METKGNKVSVYTLLNRWLHDGSKTSKLPEEIIEAKNIGPQYILYYFKDSVYNIWINEHFNNYYMFSLDKEDVFKFMKECVRYTGYSPDYYPRYNNTIKKLTKALMIKFPYLKKEDVDFMADMIDNGDDADQIYETLGLKNPKKKKMTKKGAKELRKIISENQAIQDVSSVETYLKGFTIER